MIQVPLKQRHQPQAQMEMVQAKAQVMEALLASAQLTCQKGQRQREEQQSKLA